MSVRICGNSHIVALRKGYASLKKPRQELNIFPLGGANFDNMAFSRIEGKSVAFNVDQFTELLEKFSQKKAIDNDGIWGLSVGSFFSRLYSTAFWRMAEPSCIARDGIRPMSRGLIEALVAYDQKYVMQFFSQLVTQGIDFFVIIGPPPAKNYTAIEQGTKKETIIYLEKIARNWFRGSLTKMGVAYIDLPKGTHDKDGFLLSEFKLETWNNGKPDPHHANEKYGILVMNQIFDFLEK